MHVFNESNVFILFHFLWGCYGGALVFLGGAGAPASAAHAQAEGKVNSRVKSRAQEKKFNTLQQ